jgi:hypothetical protein
MLIGAAATIAAAVVPPQLAYTAQHQLAMLVHTAAPMLTLRPALCISDLALPSLAPALVTEHLFPRWAQAGRALTLPAVVLAGEMAPLPFVLSRPRGATVHRPQLLTSNAEVALLRNLDGMSPYLYTPVVCPLVHFLWSQPCSRRRWTHATRHVQN